MEYFGISPWTDYTAHVAVYVLVVALLLGILFAGAVFVINFSLMSTRPEDQPARLEPSDLRFLQRERSRGEGPHREYLPAEEGPYEQGFPEQETSLGEQNLLREEDMAADLPQLARERRSLRYAARVAQRTRKGA